MEPWEEAVTAEEMTAADFQSRNETLMIHDKNGKIRALCQSLAQQEELDTPSAAGDRALRVYLAHSIDDGEIPDYREEFDINVLLPPEKWTQRNRLPSASPQRIVDYDEPLNISIPPVLKSICQDLVANNYFESQNALGAAAVEWFVDPSLRDEPIEVVTDHANTPSPADDPRDLLPLSYVMDTKARRRLIDFFLTDAAEDKPLTKAEISRKTDSSPTTIIKHIDTLVEFGIVETVGENRERYLPATDTESFQVLIAANQVLEAELIEE